MPEEGIKLISHNDILSFDEIVDVVKVAVSLGVNKVRLTGGEPLVRKGIVDLVSMIAKIPGVNDLGMTTNGQLLAKYAQDLADAGLSRVNVSLDTMNPDKYRQITRLGDIEPVFEGLKAAVAAKLTPVKINCVVKNSSNEPDAVAVKEFSESMGYQARFIHQMDLDTGYFTKVEGGEGGDCVNCNRLRLTANGLIMPCLFSDVGYNIRELGVKEAILTAVKNKPEHGGVSHNHKFYNIGG
jgi:cyclic pyranopterin phosphate synthase